jgi:hypothetical protein
MRRPARKAHRDEQARGGQRHRRRRARQLVLLGGTSLRGALGLTSAVHEYLHKGGGRRPARQTV